LEEASIVGQATTRRTNTNARERGGGHGGGRGGDGTAGARLDKADVADVGRTPTRRRMQPFGQVLGELAAFPEHAAVELDPRRQHGKPVIAGTRVPVSVVLTYVAAGQPLAEIARAFDVSVTQLRAAIDFAAEVLDQDVGA
jgi:uncharacterized protein (DUF433 family)